MLNRLIILLIGITVVFCSCYESTNNITEVESLFKERIDEFNSTSTYFYIDSVGVDSNSYTIYATDTLGYYIPTRHYQNYTLACMYLFDNSTLGKIERVYIKVLMIDRKDGDIDNQINKPELLKALAPFNDIKFKNKIIALNRYNHKKYMKQKKKDRDLIHYLNVYYGHQIVNGDHWSGNDSYFLIQGYLYNKAMMYDLTEHNRIIDGILQDTSWFKNAETQQQLFDLIKK